MGGSYGGYATLAGVAFTPDVYAGAVSIFGPSNLITFVWVAKESRKVVKVVAVIPQMNTEPSFYWPPL